MRFTRFVAALAVVTGSSVVVARMHTQTLTALTPPVSAETSSSGALTNRQFMNTTVTSGWSGQVDWPPPGDSWTAGQATFTVPSCSSPNDGTSGPWYATAQIGFDGPNGAAVATGMLCQVDSNGAVTTTPFFIFTSSSNPHPVLLLDANINVGDTLYLGLKLVNSSYVEIEFDDTITGASFSLVTTQPGAQPISGSSLGYIVTTFVEAGASPVGIANWNNVLWQQASVFTAKGGVYGAVNPYLRQQQLDIEENGQIVTEQVDWGSNSNNWESMENIYKTS